MNPVRDNHIEDIFMHIYKVGGCATVVYDDLSLTG